MLQPLVSVRVITYNHEKYIAQCLEGILMQRTNFPFEVIVGEDCSTDRTREIVLDYQARFPDKIRVITSETNVGGMANVIRVQQACRGKYHALCEGDDYWIDPLKLQKQVNLMEAHPEVSLCFHNTFIMNDEKTYSRLHFITHLPEILDFDDACQLPVPILTVMARSEILATLPNWRTNIIFGDILLRLWCAHHGKLAYLDDVMSVYRRNGESITHVLKSNLSKSHLDRVNIYRKFDAETGYQHTTAIQSAIQSAKDMYRREQMGWGYFIFYPRGLFRKLKKYWILIASEKKLW